MSKRNFLSLLVVFFLGISVLGLHAETEVREGYIEFLGGKTWYKIVGSGDAIPLILVNGGPGVPHDYLEPLEAQANVRPVIFYDQRGCGNSDPLAPTYWTVEFFVEELRQIIDQLELEEYHILGHSWGTAIVTDYALTQPEGLVSLIIGSPLLSTQLWVEDQREYLQTLPENLQQAIYEAEETQNFDSPEYQEAMTVYYQLYLCRVDPWPEPLLRAFGRQNVEMYTTMWGPSEFTCTGTLRDYDRTLDLYTIEVPTLFTCGKYDEAAPDTVAYFQSLVLNSKLKKFNKSSHTPMLEQPHRYNKEIRKFLRKVERHLNCNGNWH